MLEDVSEKKAKECKVNNDKTIKKEIKCQKIIISSYFYISKEPTPSQICVNIFYNMLSRGKHCA